MAGERQLVFGPFRLDLDNERLWQGEKELRLAPKAFAVLHYLIEHRGRLVTKDELFGAVWPEVTVGDAALTFSVGEIRQALGDQAKAPQFIETVHRRGYRFIEAVQSLESRVQSQNSTLTPSPRPLTPNLVGRALARPRWWQASWNESLPLGNCGLDVDNASNTMGQGKLICRFWRRWGGCVGNQEASASSNYWASMRLPGWCRCPRSSVRLTLTCSSAR